MAFSRQRFSYQATGNWDVFETEQCDYLNGIQADMRTPDAAAAASCMRLSAFFAASR
jgi:hypothetical protein